MDLDEIDWKGLIRESYRIEGIGPGECRSIFLDWAISVKGEADPKTQIRILLEHYGGDAPDHPMTSVLREGLGAAPAAGRRGGRSRRRG
jgi:hypothetical protein